MPQRSHRADPGPELVTAPGLVREYDLPEDAAAALVRFLPSTVVRQARSGPVRAVKVRHVLALLNASARLRVPVVTLLRTHTLPSLAVLAGLDLTEVD